MVLYLKLAPVLHQRVSGDSIEIFMRCERVAFPKRFFNGVFIIFIWEKERSTEAVPAGIAKHTFLGFSNLDNCVSIIELVD